MAKEKKPTQSERVLKYIRDFGCITTWQAYQDLGVSRLSARIFELKEQGFEISKKCVTTKNRYGDKTHYYEYRLVNQNAS